MSFETDSNRDTLRWHRHPRQWRRMPQRAGRALRKIHSEVMKDVPSPLAFGVGESRGLSSLSRLAVIREVVSMEGRAEIDEFAAKKNTQKGVWRMPEYHSSLFDRSDYARAIAAPGSSPSLIEGYLQDFVSEYPYGETISAEIGGVVITGVNRNERGSRFVGFSLIGEGASQIVQEKAAIRLGIDGYEGRIFSMPHISVLETRDQKLAEQLQVELADIAMRGSAVVFGNPELFCIHEPYSMTFRHQQFFEARG